jgi:hypothetical protein
LVDVDTALVSGNESFGVARGWWFADRHAATIAFVGARAEAGRRFDVSGFSPKGGRPLRALVDQGSHSLARIDEQRVVERVITSLSDLI